MSVKGPHPNAFCRIMGETPRFRLSHAILALFMALAVWSSAYAASELAGQPATAGMVMIPAGWFEMGDANGPPDQRPQRRIWLDEFWMDATEVTNQHFAEFMNHNHYPANDQRLAWPNFDITLVQGRFVAKTGMANLPVTQVTWQEARDYCAWRGKKLPSEAQWEKAARGGLAGKRYPKGDEITREDANLHRWWDPRPQTVASHPANGYGLYDMAGNVAEYCRDFYDKNYYSRAPEKNPCNQQPNPTMRRVVRGGSFSQPHRHAQTSRRFFISQRHQERN